MLGTGTETIIKEQTNMDGRSIYKMELLILKFTAEDRISYHIHNYPSKIENDISH